MSYGDSSRAMPTGSRPTAIQSWMNSSAMPSVTMRISSNRKRRSGRQPTWSGPRCKTFIRGLARFLAMPMSLIGNAVSHVYMSKAASAHRQGTLHTLVTQVHNQLSLVALPLMMLLWVTGPDVFAVLFGESWRGGGELARWMTPWLYFLLVASPLCASFAVLEKQAQGVVFQTCLFLARLAAIALGAMWGSEVVAVALCSFGSAACWLGVLVWLIALAGGSFQSLLYPFIKNLAVNCLLLSPMILCHVLEASFLFWVVASALTLSTQFAYLWRELRTVVRLESHAEQRARIAA